jgi:hypothetical protein
MVPVVRLSDTDDNCDSDDKSDNDSLASDESGPETYVPSPSRMTAADTSVTTTDKPDKALALDLAESNDELLMDVPALTTPIPSPRRRSARRTSSSTPIQRRSTSASSGTQATVTLPCRRSSKRSAREGCARGTQSPVPATRGAAVAELTDCTDIADKDDDSDTESTSPNTPPHDPSASHGHADDAAITTRPSIPCPRPMPSPPRPVAKRPKRRSSRKTTPQSQVPTKTGATRSTLRTPLSPFNSPVKMAARRTDDPVASPRRRLDALLSPTRPLGTARPAAAITGPQDDADSNFQQLTPRQQLLHLLTPGAVPPEIIGRTSEQSVRKPLSRFVIRCQPLSAFFSLCHCSVAQVLS